PGPGPVTQPARLDLTTPGPSPASSHHGDPRTRRYRAVCAPTTRTAPHSIDAQEFMPNTRPLPADPGQSALGGAAVGVGPGVVGVELDRSVEVGDRFVVPAGQPVRLSPVGVGPGVVRVESDRP